MIYAQVYMHAFKLKRYSLGKFVGNNAMKILQAQETDEKIIVKNSSTLNIINTYSAFPLQVHILPPSQSILEVGRHFLTCIHSLWICRKLMLRRPPPQGRIYLLSKQLRRWYFPSLGVHLSVLVWRGSRISLHYWTCLLVDHDLTVYCHNPGK